MAGADGRRGGPARRRHPAATYACASLPAANHKSSILLALKNSPHVVPPNPWPAGEPLWLPQGGAGDAPDALGPLLGRADARELAPALERRVMLLHNMSPFFDEVKGGETEGAVRGG